MGLRRWLKRLERSAESETESFALEDGERVVYTSADYFEALKAAIAGEQHWLVDAAHQANTMLGVPGLLWALSASRRRLDNGA